MVANILDRRKEVVQLVAVGESSDSPTSAFPHTVGSFPDLPARKYITQTTTIHRTPQEPFIERQLVEAVVQKHRGYAQGSW